MIEDRFLYRRQCNEAHHLTPFDRAPVYDPEDSRVEETFIDDRRPEPRGAFWLIDRQGQC